MAAELTDEIVTEPTPRFEVDDPAWLDYFRENGYVVLKDVASQENITHARELCIDWLERLWADMGEDSSFKFSDISTWMYMPISSRNGIVSSAGACQSDFVWYCRLLPKVRQAFEKLWNTDDLICSMDAFNIFRPWQIEGYEPWKTDGGWFHVDQNHWAANGTGKGFVCVQGLLNLYPCTAETGGLTVIPKTHLRHADYCDKILGRHRAMNQHYVPMDVEQLEITTKPKLVTCEAGDFCLWDSRTIHCNSPGVGLENPPTLEDPDFMRLACYICMTETSRATPEVLKNRMLAFNNHNGATHWPHLWVERRVDHFVPRTEITLTEDVKRLIRGNKKLDEESKCSIM